MKYLKELIAVYSDEPSYFSKKRLESGVSFLLGQLGMVSYIIANYSVMSVSEVLMWATLQFTISGYVMTHIQKEKQNNKPI